MHFNPISDITHIASKVWNEIIYPFPNINDCAVVVSEYICKFILHFIADDIIMNVLIHAGINANLCE